MPRPSPVRDRVTDLLLHGSQHVWALDELLVQVREETGSGDYSTVFRAVEYLERKGLVERVDLGDGRARYEPIAGHHDHVVCTGCGRVADTGQDCVVDEAASRVSKATGFAISGHQLIFSGLCAACQER